MRSATDFQWLNASRTGSSATPAYMSSRARRGAASKEGSGSFCAWIVARGGGFVRGVNWGEVGGELAQYTDGCGLIVDEDATLAADGDFTAQDELAIAFIEAVAFEHRREGFLGSASDLEHGGQHGLLRAGA